MLVPHTHCAPPSVRQVSPVSQTGLQTLPTQAPLAQCWPRLQAGVHCEATHWPEPSS
jgi:hypothetical protein